MTFPTPIRSNEVSCQCSAHLIKFNVATGNASDAVLHRNEVKHSSWRAERSGKEHYYLGKIQEFLALW